MVSLTNCQRCGGEHRGLIAHRYRDPVGMDGFTHWVACPDRNGEPFLVDWHYVTTTASTPARTCASEVPA